MSSIEHEFRSLLAQMQLLAGGKCQSFNASGGKGESEGDGSPSGDGRPMYLRYREKWADAEEHKKPSILAKGREELAGWKVRAAPAPDVDPSLEELVLTDGRGYAAEQVAHSRSIDVAFVRRIRRRADLDPEFGSVSLKVPDAPAPVLKDGSRERILDLHAQGCTVRQIGSLTGVAKSTVNDVIARQRRAA